MTHSTEGWLIIKRDLYFRPDCKGYTGIRDEAGRYSLDFAKEHECEGTSIIHESEAPEFREAAYSDLVVKHLIKQRDEARAERDAAVREMLTRVITKVDELYVANPGVTYHKIRAELMSMGLAIVATHKTSLGDKS